jgi:arginyl-tRNA synthetase
VLSFPSDVSLGIAKALMVVEDDFAKGEKTLSFFDEPTDVVIAYLGESYVKGVKVCEESFERIEKAKEVLTRMYAHVNGTLSEDESQFAYLMDKTRSINEEYFKGTLKGIGSHVDQFIYEAESGKVGESIVKEYAEAGKVFTKSEGAIVYIPEEERKDLNTAVFINSQGYPTYEAKDIGLIELKFSMYQPDFSFTVTDQEQLPHFKIVFAAAEKLNDEWKSRIEKSIHVPHGRMLFKGAKMSSRLGGVPLALQVIGEVEEEVKERAGEKIAHLGEEAKQQLERDIALSAIRISVLRSKPGININFDPETSLSFEGDSGPYLLYTHARCCSLLDKGEVLGIMPLFAPHEASLLERDLARFSVVMQDAVETLQPQKLVSYVFGVASLFNSYYASNQILSEDMVESAHRLMITKRTQFVINEILSVLGITAPREM